MDKLFDTEYLLCEKRTITHDTGTVTYKWMRFEIVSQIIHNLIVMVKGVSKNTIENKFSHSYKDVGSVHFVCIRSHALKNKSNYTSAALGE